MDKFDPAKKVALVIDEWGAWLRPQSQENFFFLRQQNSLRDAILASINLNIFARHADRVKMANIAQMVNVIQSMILTDGPKMVLTPTYQIFKMYVPFQDATYVDMQFDAGEYRMGDTILPRLDGIAARDKDGVLWLAITNIDPNHEAEVKIDGVTARSAQGQVLTADRVNAINSFDKPTAVAPRPYEAHAEHGVLKLSLEPKSVTVVRLTP